MEKFDVAIIGAGATGLAAAVSAAQHGAKVVVFEKEKNFGGTGNFFEGTFAVGSHFQREIFETYSTDQAFKYIMEYSHWLANPRLVRAIIEESASTIEWLEDAGVEFYGARINLPESPRTYHVAKGMGAAVMAALYKKAKELGVDIRLETPVVEILKEGGKIVGLIADQNGDEIEIEAPAVVIGSGGYLNNKEWVKKYTGFTLGEDLFVVGNVDKMGDGIRMAWELGAAEEGIEVLEMFSMGPNSPNFATHNDLEAVSMQPDLWVDIFGRRFCDEAVTFYDTTVGNVSSKCPQGVSWRIFDTSTVERIKATTDLDKNAGQAGPPGTLMPNIEDDINANLENNPEEVVGADTIEELAGKMGIDPAVLKATVEEYNTCCAQGHDPIFAKDRKWLRPITGPKYYAIKGHTVCLGTKGGIRINENMEVVDKKWQVIPGLYAGGYDAGGLYGDSYTIAGSSGLSSGYAMNSGKIAGRNAAAYAKD